MEKRIVELTRWASKDEKYICFITRYSDNSITIDAKRKLKNRGLMSLRVELKNGYPTGIFTHYGKPIDCVLRSIVSRRMKKLAPVS